MKDVKTTDVLVIGSSITAWMTAGWLAHKESLRVTVVGPEVADEQRPIVGESTVEPAALFFRDLGVPNFDETHNVKQGLTFYHKLRPGDPSDERYSVHAPERHLAHDSRQLHRPRFDRELAAHGVAGGVVHVVGKARTYSRVDGEHRHQVEVKTKAGTEIHAARWIVDASGRTRFLGKKVTSYSSSEDQRCAFWLRLADFEPFLPTFDGHARREVQYDLWDSTHHFMGHGHWIWGIPLKGSEYSNLISIGLTWHPGVLPDGVRDLESFLSFCDVHHPPVARMVRSGTVLDTNLYANYLYAADQLYDPDGWFLVGDAARTVDPLYSTGLSMTSIQVQQVARMIRRDRAGELTRSDTEALAEMWTFVAARRQRDIASQYATMGDPWKAHLRRYWNLNQWFNGVLPLWFNGYLTDPDAARMLLKVSRDDRADHTAFFDLLSASGERLGPIEHAHLDDSFDFDRLLDRHFDCPPEEALVHMARMFRMRALMRVRMLWLARGADSPRQLKVAGSELFRSVMLPLLGRRNRELIAALERPLGLPPEPAETRSGWRDLALLLAPRNADRLRALRR